MMEKFCLVFTMPWISFTIINIPPTVRQVSPNLFFFLPNHIYPLIYPSYGHHLQSSTSRRLLDRYPLSSSSLSLITYILSILIRCSVQHVPPLPLTVTPNHIHRLIHYSSYCLTSLLFNSQVSDQWGIWGWIWFTSTRRRTRYT